MTSNRRHSRTRGGGTDTMHHIAYSESLRRTHHDAAEATRRLPDPETRRYGRRGRDRRS